jgi:hypothetical protein
MPQRRRTFDPQRFVTTVGQGRTLVSVGKGQTIYAQGDAADALYVIKKGTVKLSAKSGERKQPSTSCVTRRFADHRGIEWRVTDMPLSCTGLVWKAAFDWKPATRRGYGKRRGKRGFISAR